MHLVAYQSKASNQTLVCIKTFSSDGSEYKISALVTPSDKGSSLDAFLLFSPIADTDPEAADWTKLKEKIKAGTPVAATQVSLTLDTKKTSY